MMSAKSTTPGFLKIVIFWNKSYEVIISAHDVRSKILHCESNYIVDGVWPKFYVLSFFQFLEDLIKNRFFRSWFRFNDLGLLLGMVFKFYCSLVKGLELKVRTSWWLISKLAEVTRENPSQRRRSFHCVKSIRIRGYFGPHFSRIWTEYGGIVRISLYPVRMREDAGKMQTRITPNTVFFYEVFLSQTHTE